MNLDQQMALLFVEEAAELLADFEQALLLLESLPDDVELLSRIFRCAHTLKGNAKMLGFEAVATFTHQLENLLDKLRKQELVVTQGVANTLFASLDLLKSLVAEVAGGPSHDEARYASTQARIEALVADLQGGLMRAPEPPVLRFPDDRAEATENGSPKYEEAVVPKVVGAVVAEPGPPQQAQAHEAEVQATPVRTDAKAGEPPVGGTGKEPAQPAKERRVDGENSSVRVPIDKLDRLINLTGEVVIAQSMIAQLVTELTPERINLLQELVAQMERHCRELQERMLGARMLPIKSVFARFQRLVRDLGAASGKGLVLEVSGEDTELDKTVIEKIADPLTHLVRNAIDHGIETLAERRLTTKPEQAVLRLSAYQKSGSIFIDVSDDGRGLNRDKILTKARKLGLVREDEQLSDEQVYALIFQAGFSTAEQVTEISGRGVGMDVVRRNVEALKGTISIHTKLGEGTTFRVKLPLTLAILDGLGLRIGDQVYLVPLIAVVESLRPSAAEVRKVANLGEVVDVRGEYLPLIRLYQLFGVTPLHHSAHEGLVMVVDDGVQRFALQIDELIGQFQVVIKSLEANFQAVAGISGATVLGDGRVALILDTANLAALASARSHKEQSERSRVKQVASASAQRSIGSQT